MTWSSTEVMRLRRSLESGQLTQNGAASAKVALILEDGTQYGETGTLQFADVSVDPSTGSISLRAVVPNPKSELLPGMFVRAKIEEGTDPNAVLVPQRAVARDQNGRPTALVVLADNKVERRTLETDRVIGDSWLVTKGVGPGDRVIVEGLQKVRPGATVVPGPVAAVAEAPAGGGSALSAGMPAATNASGGGAAGSGSAAGK
jgi:membrane fusion protein (multidrug efflux system)